MGEVDPAFIRDVEHRPKLPSTQAEGIPLIDLTGYSPSDGPFDASATIEERVAEEGEACKKLGFFAVVNHGVAVEKRERIEREAREFFGQGLEEKKELRRNEKRVVGYYEMEHTKNVRDWKEVFDLPCKSRRSSRPRSRTAKRASLSGPISGLSTPLDEGQCFHDFFSFGDSVFR